MSAYSIYQLTLGAGKIVGIVDQQITSGNSSVVFQGGGVLDPQNVATMTSDQSLSVSSNDVKGALTAFGLNAVDLSTSNLVAYAQKVGASSTFTAGTTHMSFTSALGLGVISGISAQQDSVASVNLNFMPISDGVNNPVVIADGVAVPALTRETERYTLGTLEVNGVPISLQSLSLNFNLGVQSFGDNGFPYKTFVGLMSRNPVIEITTNDLSEAAVYALQGSALAGDVVFYLRKVAVGGARVPNITAEHIKFTIKEGQISPSNIGGSSGLSTMSFTITPVYDGTNDIIAIDTASAIA